MTADGRNARPPFSFAQTLEWVLRRVPSARQTPFMEPATYSLCCETKCGAVCSLSAYGRLLMFFKRIGLIAITLGLGIGVTGCTDGYGYGGAGVGYASDPYYGGGYGDGYYGAGFGGVNSYYGWSGDYYYPGSGVFVYDRYRRPYRWNGAQQRYWQGRRGNYRGAGNWGNFARGNSPAAQAYRQDRRGDNRAFRQDRRQDRNQLRNGQITPDQFRAERGAARQAYRAEARQDRREFRQSRPGGGNRGGFGGGNRGGGGRGNGGRGLPQR